MRRLLLATTTLLALATGANADVMLQFKLSGTGDNVIADTVSTNSALGHLNGQHLDVVRYTGLSNGFTGATSGNDIKIDNTVGITIQVFDPFDVFVIGTTTQVFSLVGTGDVGLIVQATDAFNNAETFTFDLGTIDPHAQSGFTLTATNGEVMTALALLDVGGSIAEFEHNRIDVAALAPVPTPIAGTGPLFVSGLVGLWALARRRKHKLTA